MIHVKTDPYPFPQTGLRSLQAMLRERHPLAAMQVLHDDLGDIFWVNLPGNAGSVISAS